MGGIIIMCKIKLVLSQKKLLILIFFLENLKKKSIELEIKTP